MRLLSALPRVLPVAALIFAAACTQPRVITGITISGDQAKLIYAQANTTNTGLIQCTVIRGAQPAPAPAPEPPPKDTKGKKTVAAASDGDATPAPAAISGGPPPGSLTDCKKIDVTFLKKGE
jgi:hypothetical protein